ncbi:hypothetical protein ACFE04_005820 [Oxalis oulophora]
MSVMGRARGFFVLTGRIINEIVSFIVFTLLDMLDFTLCFLFKVADYVFEAEWKQCYCSSSSKIVVGESKIVCSLSSSSSKIQLEEISDTLYTRPSLVSEVCKFTFDEFKKLKIEDNNFSGYGNVEMVKKVRCTSTKMTTYTINNSTKIGEIQPRWSDCDCKICHSWTSSCKDTLFVKTLDQSKGEPKEDVLFIHGFISSSAFWTETLFPNFSTKAKSTYRLIAVDLLGFGRSPKPTDSLYTLREHIDMIEKSVIEPYKVKSFHIVAHSLGCILALALAVKHPNSVKSLTLLAPPYYPVPKGAEATQYVMKQVAPRRVWPPMSFGASITCWYEHITRTACLLISKNHQLWESLTKLENLVFSSSSPSFKETRHVSPSSSSSSTNNNNVKRKEKRLLVETASSSSSSLDEPPPAPVTLDRKVSRSRSVGCGSRSFYGDFFERISTGFGDCTLRRVE